VDRKARAFWVAVGSARKLLGDRSGPLSSYLPRGYIQPIEYVDQRDMSDEHKRLLGKMPRSLVEDVVGYGVWPVSNTCLSFG
jgi:hypothetical protein